MQNPACRWTQRLVHSGIESTGQTIDALEAALEQKADCLLCGDDEIAYEVCGELRNRHILVPHDLRVASLYDSSMLASITPSVSAVQYDAEQLGRTACRMLLDRLLGKEMVQCQIEGYQVILRESTNDAGYHTPVAEYVQQAWGELGITVNINKVEWASFTPLRRAGDYDVSRNGWVMDYNDPPT